VLDELAAYADVIVVATPPVQAGPAALSWGRAVDGTVLVARRDHAKREDVSAASETLIHVGGNLVGTILAERPAPLSGLFGRGRSGSSRMVPVAPPQSRPTQMATQMATATAAPAAASYGPAPSQMAAPVAPTLRPAIVRASAPVSPMPHVTTIGPVPQSVPAASSDTSESSDTDELAEEVDEDGPAAPAPKRSPTTTGRSTTARPRSAGRSTTSRSGPNTTS
jgi:hypothetical protein